MDRVNGAQGQNSWLEFQYVFSPPKANLPTFMSEPTDIRIVDGSLQTKRSDENHFPLYSISINFGSDR